MARIIFAKLFAAVLLGASTSVLGIDMQSAREQPCFNISQSAAVDFDWLTTIERFYYPTVSRLELYLSANDLVRKDPKDITESSLYYDSCITWTARSNGSIVSRGFNGLSRNYEMIPNDDVVRLQPVEGIGNSGTMYFTLTDNKTFLFQSFCTDDGEMTWGLASPLTKLPTETINLVHEHAESLGFKREYFEELRYDACNLDDFTD